ncbi:hypothetical protein AA23498_1761 [Acetobacter nitrogenifigens DSM 23921 = NBRC 105050]|uniref:Porin domain-containing protein n=1 Tax=Acetobacter nitrogenifigens DSM 23921 = NBRC 105050 TaxID=1120919 RepID=A0A511X9H8_9PROT|nr:hypothetical protein [Acetobacter nitrogenifigens]GBQ93539.1 hypothetical protein AA23498_1761 [Acetobacter nitrogenifigens DSM 23921 = NBRC 105050]GEN59599.1 hypothetical protein ANI02nite_14830 [Acetobacter nitrogenifigens DSM 23921 = NBRC 105050]
MQTRHSIRLGLLLTVAAGCAVATSPRLARADDYSDLLDILRAKGSLTGSEYNTLLAKHLHRGQASEVRSATPVKGRRSASTAHGTTTATVEDPVVFEAQRAADDAARSARSAQEALAETRMSMKSASVVRVAPYVPGKGLTFSAGPVDITLSGFINGFYSYNSPGGGHGVAGGVSTGSSKFDQSGVRNGLLPAGLILKVATTQSGIDLAGTLGMYPGLNNAASGAFNANSGGSAVGLGTPGIDFRQIFITAGTKTFGTVKIGRDLALFASDAILSDATLLSVGSTGGTAAPANTSLGRIGVGYVYADWIPQISYASPVYKGLQGTIGIFQPLDEYNYAGSGLSATSTHHSSPMVQGKVTYDFTVNKLTGRIWSSFLVQRQQSLTGSDIDTGGRPRSVVAEAGDIGTKLTWRGAQLVAYYYRGSGLGTTGLFFDGVAANGRKRASEGYYVQFGYNFTKKFKLIGSYGASNLYRAPGDYSPSLVRRNESEIGAGYYALTDWLTLVAEYAHTRSAAHGPFKEDDSTISAGASIFF